VRADPVRRFFSTATISTAATRWRSSNGCARNKAKKGAAFDQQAFHDDLLSLGTVPVSVVAGEMLEE